MGGRLVVPPPAHWDYEADLCVVQRFLPEIVGALYFGGEESTLVNEHAQVLCPDGRPIPGLYAGGNAAAGISGHGADGYLSGNGLLAALGLGRIAGLHAATRIERR